MVVPNQFRIFKTERINHSTFQHTLPSFLCHEKTIPIIIHSLIPKTRTVQVRDRVLSDSFYIPLDPNQTLLRFADSCLYVWHNWVQRPETNLLQVESANESAKSRPSSRNVFCVHFDGSTMILGRNERQQRTTHHTGRDYNTVFVRHAKASSGSCTLSAWWSGTTMASSILLFSVPSSPLVGLFLTISLSPPESSGKGLLYGVPPGKVKSGRPNECSVYWIVTKTTMLKKKAPNESTPV
jgi:hypothetical protein